MAILNDGRNLLTHSRVQTFKTCPKKHFLKYGLGLQKEVQSEPLRMGSAFHLAKEIVRKGGDHIEAIATALKPYEVVPAWADAFSWSVEREKVYRLLIAYLNIWKDDGLTIIATELPFELPIVNPETGKATQKYRMAGKIDGIVKLPDGRLAVDETKTTGQPIDDAADYWLKLRIDEQISRYMYAARKLGYDVVTVHYDVIRKPTISPKQVALLDEQGCKIVLDISGERVFNRNGTPKQGGSTEQGWTLQTRVETAAEYGERLSLDICERPEFYFNRKEIVRTDSDLEEFAIEQWQQQKTISEAELNGRHFRNTGACLHPFKCEYFDVCTSGMKPSAENVPQGFRLVDHVHPELESEE